jgi:multiple sugar transport system permease protein
MNITKMTRKTLTYATLFVFLLCALFPIYWMFITSIKTEMEVYNLVPTFWPQKIVWASYTTVFSDQKFVASLRNSLFVATVVSLITIVVSVLAAYAISKLKFLGRKVMSKSILYAYLMPRTVLFIPLYILVCKLGLNNNIFAMVLLYPTFTIPYATWMLISYFASIPKELEEAAVIDGCSKVGAMLRIIFPLSMPGIISTMIFSFTLCWSEYLYALVVLTDEMARTFPLALSNMIVADVFAWGPLMAGAMVATVPVTIMYMFASRYMISGMTLGGVKG